MKLCATLTLALMAVIGLAQGSPARKRMVYYQQPAAAEWYGAAPHGQQRFMYMQYVQPGRSFARSTQAASALVSGETVATGTYVKEAAAVDDAASGESQLADAAFEAAGAHGATSVAEAYPAEHEEDQGAEATPVVQIAVDSDSSVAAAEQEASDDAAKVPRDFNFPAEVPVEPVSAELPVPESIVPVAVPVPAHRYLPAQKKKVIVELDQSSVENEDAHLATVEDEEEENVVADDVEEDEEEEVHVVPVKPVVVAKRPAARRPAAVPQKPLKAANKPSNKPAQLPAGTFFPIDFGGTNGGAIAIANAFSTGEGGAATSHAIAYGSPDAARARVRPNPSKFRH